ncbi:hypothetical protein RNJ44_00417 [Nakaseomyces bracarensis]|uniref:FAD-binding FR-type domain-containing protein n=1 Tax=Nakaseomyces bracarensis TaxID=273131 RepID=A0ABR4NSI1_9SACH
MFIFLILISVCYGNILDGARSVRYHGFQKKDLWENNAVMACATYTTRLPWLYEAHSTSFYEPICNYKPAMGSWITCIHDMLVDDKELGEKSFDYSFIAANKLCSVAEDMGHTHHLGFMNLTEYYSVLQNASDYIRRYNGSVAEPINYPIRVEKRIRETTLYAYHAHSFNLDRSNVYGALMNVYFLFVVGVLGVFHFLDHIGLRKRSSRLMNKIRAQFCVPALFGKSHAQYVNFKIFHGLLPVNVLLPTRLESLILLGYFLLHMILIATDYVIDPNNVLFKSKNLQLVRYLADRTGILAFAQFPIIIIFSTRNNVLEYLTGMHYSSFIAFHKWIGRFMTIDAILHSLFYTAYSLCYHTFESSRKQAYWQFGFIALVVTLILCIFSLGYMRVYFYETFLYLHIFLAFLLFVCCWKHVEKIGWGQWLCFAIFFWIVEKCTRVYKILRFGFPESKVKIYFDELGNPEYLKLIVPKGKARKNWVAKPGQYGFVYFMTPLHFWQSHPFTIEDDGSFLRLVIRPKSGLTGSLINYVLKNGINGEMLMRVSIEGPYGSNIPLKHYDDVLLFSGGSGIPGPLAHAIECLPMTKLSENKYVELVIVARDTNILKAYAKDLLKLKNSPVIVSLYLTTKFNTHRMQKFDVPDSSTPLLQESSAAFVELLSFIPIHYGRPDIASLINEHCKDESRSLAVVSCGPPVLVDSTRSICTNNIKTAKHKSIAYYEEFQCW